MSLLTRALILAGLVAAALVGWHRLTAYHQRIGYERAAAECRAASEAQRETNQLRARAAEKGAAQAQLVRDRFITQTITEVRHATAALEPCLVGADAVRLLNAAPDRAGQD